MTKGQAHAALMARVGARIECLRLERGLSIHNLARMAECSIGYLLLMESGVASINVCTLEKLARALQVEPFDLLNHSPENDDGGWILEMLRKYPAQTMPALRHLSHGR